MDIGRFTEKMMGMDDAAWRRHTNPWSGWTRLSVLPLVTLVIWFRQPLGWIAWGLLAILLLWTWLNARLFPEPASTDNWMSEVVMGERVWLNRKTVPIPQRHVRMAFLLNLLTASGLPFLAYGLWKYDPGFALLGLALVLIGKLWFVDRMVWLYEDMRKIHPPYQEWLT